MVDGSSKPGGSPTSLEQVFSEADFLPLLAERIRPVLEVCDHAASSGGGAMLSSAIVSTLEDRARQLETFLDDFDARSNRTFAPFTEVVASVQVFASTAYTLHHLLARLPSYALHEPAAYLDAFLPASKKATSFVQGALRSLLTGLVVEAKRILGAAYPKVVDRLVEPPIKPARFRLPRNLDLSTSLSDRDKVAELAAQYLGHLRTLDGLSTCSSFDDLEAMRRYVLDVSDEEQCRYFGARIHNLQSMYDTFLKSTAVEASDGDLKVFRGHVSLTLHLVECMTGLVRFYEKHENDIRNEQTKALVSGLVEKPGLLDAILNFCLLRAGKPVVERLIARYTSQSRVVVAIPDGVTLHARPVALIAKVVAHHGTPVDMEIGATKVYAGSMLRVLMAVGSNPTARSVAFVGDRAPVDDLVALFAARLGEDGAGSLPSSLSYLGV
jgi:phosphotransferase system HPr-like phosphotransfer protein